jgi:hypothetical protein
MKLGICCQDSTFQLKDILNLSVPTLYIIYIYLFIGVSTVLNILDNYINMCLLTPRYTDWKAPARRLDLYGWVA